MIYERERVCRIYRTRISVWNRSYVRETDRRKHKRKKREEEWSEREIRKRKDEHQREREESAAGDESLCHFVMSCREETRQKEEREASNSFWNFGNARGPKSLCCSGRRKDVSVSTIKGSVESSRRVLQKIQSRLPPRDKIIPCTVASEPQTASVVSFNFPTSNLSRFTHRVNRFTRVYEVFALQFVK